MPVNSLVPGIYGTSFQNINTCYWLSSWIFPVKLLSGDCHRMPLVIINIGSGYGLLPDDNKPWQQPLLTKNLCHHVDLTHWPEWHHMASWNKVNNVSSNGLLPDGTKPLYKLQLTPHQWGQLKAEGNFTKIYVKQISWYNVFENYCLKLQPLIDNQRN